MTVRSIGNGTRLVLPALQSGRFQDQSSIYLTAAMRARSGRQPSSVFGRRTNPLRGRARGLR
jgi:hypothetical protein